MYRERLPEFLRKPDPNIFMTSDYVVLDGEMTRRGRDARQSSLAIYKENEVVCFSWYTSIDDTLHNHYGGEYEFFDLVQACYDTKLLVGHNIKFDLQWLSRCGLDLRRVMVYDTMLGEYVLTGNQLSGVQGALKLDTLSRKYNGEGKEPFIDICMRSGICPSDMPKSMLIERCNCDVMQTRGVFLKQRGRLKAAGLLPVQYTRCIFTPCLADIELAGVHLDRTAVIGEYNADVRRFDEVSAELDTILGGRNPRSVPQMRELIYEVLGFPPVKKGRTALYPTGEEVLSFTPKNKRQEKFLQLKKEFAQLNANLTKNLEYFYGVVTETTDDLFYAQFNQAVTKTHRLSSTGINTKFAKWPHAKSIQLQNSPRKYKCLYSARNKGWLVAEADGAQIEFRVAAFLGQDVNACQAIVDDFDVHTFTASVLNDMSIDEIKKLPNFKALRTDAKPDTFKPLYGGQFGTKAQMAYYKAFREMYPQIAETQLRWEKEALANKSVRAVTGLTFYYPGAMITNGGYNPEWPSICNYQVQNLATGEIVPVAITLLWHLIKDMQCFLVNTVHDSCVLETPPDEVAELHSISKWSFLDGVYDYLEEVYHLDFNVPLGVGFEAGPHWGEGEETKTSKVPRVHMAGVDYSRLKQE